MPKCPNCGSTAQVREWDTQYHEAGSTKEIVVVRRYKCGCGCCFVGCVDYKQVSNEMIEEERPYDKRPFESI